MQMEKREKRMQQMYEMMQNPYYNYVPDRFEFTPYETGGEGQWQVAQKMMQ